MLTQERVRELFDYDSGNLIHKITKRRSRKGVVAGTYNRGYKQIGVDGTIYRAHRLVRLYFKGEHPKDQIDHINGIRDDNRIENLREVTNLENHQNMKRSASNKSGVTGVSFCKRDGKWRAYIKLDKNKFLGAFDDVSEAAKARKDAEVEYGYHSNHGRL